MPMRRNSWPLAPGLSFESQRLIADEDETESGSSSDDSTARPAERKHASIQLLHDFWPHLLSENREPRWKWTTLFSTQRRVMILQQISVALVLTTNLALIIVGAVKYPRYQDTGTIYQGRCDVAKSLNTWFHLLINVLSTLALGASNYSMQLLVAPTRTLIDKVHAKNEWLDIGVSSIRNLRYIERKKAVVWWILGFSSTCLHLVWNSAVFDSIPVYSYTTAIVTTDYVTNNAPWNVDLDLNPGGTNLEMLRVDGREFQYLNKTECILRYLSPFTSGKDLIVVTDWTDNQRALNDGSSLIAAFQNPHDGNDWDTMSIWLCYDNGTWPKTCTTQHAAVMATDWTVSFGEDVYAIDTSNNSARVDHCLSEGTHVTNLDCGFHWSITIMTLVWVVSMVELICIIFVGKWTTASSLVTLGDAISTFSQCPDPHTMQMCLSPKLSLAKSRWVRAPAQASPRGRWWFSGASRARWIFTIVSVLIALLIASFLMYLTFISLAAQSMSRSLPSLWAWGLGTANTMTLVGGWVKEAGGKDATRQFFVSVIVANLPQIVISYLYLLYNGLLTCLLVAAEWSRFAVKRKNLRVSEKAAGFQTSGFFLSMPYRFGLPFSCASSLLQWLASQSLFVVKTAGIASDGEKIHLFDGSRVGYSPIGPVFLLILGGLMLIAIILLGFKRYPSAAEFMPHPATNSAVISAASHCPAEDKHAYLFPVQWGEVDWDEELRIGHCAFSTASDVRKPQKNRDYV